MLSIPLGPHINKEVQSTLIQYFLMNSTFEKVYTNQTTSEQINTKCFPFKCIAIQMTVTEAPLQALSIKQMPGIHTQKSNNVIRALCLLFDINDDPKQK